MRLLDEAKDLLERAKSNSGYITGMLILGTLFPKEHFAD